MSASGRRSTCTPYSFEPEFTPEELQQRLDVHGHGDAEREQGADQQQRAGNAEAERQPVDRTASTDGWCTCGHCEVMATQRECLCCKEMQSCNRFGEISCITEHEDFPRVCLVRAVLRAFLIARNDIRGHVRVVPDQLDNRSYRYSSYRLFTYWLHGRLGRGVRKVIPACAVWRIRQEFPDANGQYVGFKISPDGEELEVPEQLAI